VSTIHAAQPVAAAASRESLMREAQRLTDVGSWEFDLATQAMVRAAELLTRAERIARHIPVLAIGR
jgi:hypothetical protein